MPLTIFPEFSWSFSRYISFNTCRRQYFYRYYGANGGWDNNSERDVRKIYMLKNLKSKHDWVSAIFKDALRYVLFSFSTESQEKKLKCFISAIMRAFSRERLSLKNKEWCEDPKKVNISEVYYGVENLTSVFDFAEGALKNAIDSYRDSEILSRFFSIPFISLKKNSYPDSFFISDMKIWVAPDIVAAEKDFLRIYGIDLFPHKTIDNDNSRIRLSLFAVYARETFPGAGLSPEPSILYPENGGVSVFSDKGNDAVLMKIIKDSSSEMLSFVNGSSKICEDSFPCVGDSVSAASCFKCEFKEYCFRKK